MSRTSVWNGSSQGRRADVLLRLFTLACGVALLWAVVGCGGGASAAGTGAAGSSTSSSSSSAGTGQAVSGVHGRVQAGPGPIAGAHIYLYAANHAGYGAASFWLLTPGAPGVAVDGLGPYVSTDGAGNFDLTGRYGCVPGELVYTLAQGGSASGAASNPALAMMSVLGECPAEGRFSGDSSFVNINQVSTVVTAYALGGFMADAGHLSTSDNANAAAGMRNAFAAVANLMDASAGTAYPETPEASGVVPLAEINSLANLLVPCVESSTPDACSSLFALTPDAAGHAATDTVGAVMNIARNPAANVTALYALAANGPFRPALAAAPPDWSLAVTYYAPNMAGPYFPAVDAQGNVWVPGFANNTLTEFSPTGELLSGEGGFSGGGLAQPFSVAMDPAGNAWVANFGGSAPGVPSVSQFGANGAPRTLVGSPCGQSCTFLAFDDSSNLWVSGSPSVLALKPSGAALSAFATNGFEGGLAIDSQGRGWTIGSGRALDRLTLPATVASFPESVTAASGNDLAALAIDSADHIWFLSTRGNALAKHGSDGAALSPAGGYTGGGMNAPAGLAIDGNDRVWIANRNANSISAFRNDGTAISPAAGYVAPGVSNPRGIAIDPSGNVWITNFTGNSVTEFVGLATPTATPIQPGNHGQRP